MTGLTRPSLLAEKTAPGGYELRYRFHAPAGAVLLQRVETHLRYLQGSQLVVEYRGSYGEFFRLDAEPARESDELVDVHEFDLWRDGWSQQRIRRLLRGEGVPVRARRAPGQPHLECTKTFWLGLGEVDGAGGGEFGFLEQGPGDGAASAGVFFPGSGEEEQAREANPFPYGGSGSGSGRWLERAGWRTVETYRYAFATTSGRREASGGYELAALELSAPAAPARRRS